MIINKYYTAIWSDTDLTDWKIICCLNTDNIIIYNKMQQVFILE